MINTCSETQDTENKSEFEKIYIKNRTLLFNIAFKILQDTASAEDAVQDAFLSLARNMNKISNRSCIEIRNYLIIIVRNAAFTIYNKRKKEFCCEKIINEKIDTDCFKVNDESNIVREDLFKLIKNLDAKYADVLILKYFYDMKDKEIAGALGITIENVKVRLHRGRKALKKKLIEENFYD